MDDQPPITMVNSDRLTGSYRICGQCSAKYPDSELICAFDGTNLVEVQPDGLAGFVLNGRYKLDRDIGSGGWASVYLAQDMKLNRCVAVKIVHAHIAAHPEQLERFQREGRLLCQINHPNVCSVYDYGALPDERPFIVMEYVSGRSLESLAEEARPMSVREVVEIISKVCSGLAAAHKAGVLHRDIKPSNILLQDDYLKILDFGVAKAASDAEDASLTATGQTLGTPKYMSPEQCLGTELSPSSDIYSLACIAMELLSREPLFSARQPLEYMYAHVNSAPPSLIEKRPECRNLNIVLQKALAKNPQSRYATADEFKQALLQAADLDMKQATRTAPFMAALSLSTQNWKLPQKLTAATCAIAIAISLTYVAYQKNETGQTKKIIDTSVLAKFRQKKVEAQNLIDQHDYRNARLVLNDLVTYAQLTFGQDSVESAESYALAARERADSYDFDAAATTMSRAVAIEQHCTGISEAAKNQFYFSAASLFARSQRPDLASAILKQSVKSMMNDPKSDIAPLLKHMVSLAAYQEAAQRLTDAQETLLGARAVALEKLPPNHPARVECLRLLARSYHELHDYKKATIVIGDAIKESSTSPHNEQILVDGSAALFYQDDHQYAKAIEYYRKVIDLQKRQNYELGMGINYAQCQIGPCLQGMKNYKDAEIAYKSAAEQYSANPSRDKKLLSRLYSNYASLMQQLNRPKEAQKLQKKADDLMDSPSDT